MKKRLLLSLLFASIPVAAQDIAATADIEGSSDHPWLTRFPGSQIVQWEVKPFDEVIWLGEKYRESNIRVRYREVQAEGRTTRITYLIPGEHSTLEIARSYERGLERAGFEVQFECLEDDCASIRKYLDLYGERPIGNGERFYSENRRSLVASRGQDFVFLFVYQNGQRDLVARLRVVEGEQELPAEIRVNADRISEELQQSGSIAVYDILFDVNEANVKASSIPAIGEIARFLNSNPDAGLYVVGHTDNTGSYEHNLDLSHRRAESVVKILVSEFDVIPNRLKAAGVGPIAPIAANSTEQGRAQNRRVQLVAQ